MVKKFKKIIKNQKGLTLVELLAVVVILGIIAAIAVPSIGNIIDNSKKDAHVANAQQLVSAARLAVASNDKDAQSASDDTTITFTDESLEGAGYLESRIVDPDDSGDGDNLYGTAQVQYNINDKTYTVTLEGDNRGITGEISELTREDVTP